MSMSTEQIDALATKSAALGNVIDECCKGQGPGAVMTALCVCLGKALAVYHKVTGKDLEELCESTSRTVLSSARSWLLKINGRTH